MGRQVQEHRVSVGSVTCKSLKNKSARCLCDAEEDKLTVFHPQLPCCMPSPLVNALCVINCCVSRTWFDKGGVDTIFMSGTLVTLVD